MQIELKSRLTHQYSGKRILYTLCFLSLCIIDQRTKTCSGLDGWLETFRNLLGVIMAVIILSHYKIEDFRKWKIPYLIWSILGILGGICAFFWGIDRQPFLNEWLMAIIDVLLFGYVVIHTFIDWVFEKKRPDINKKFMAVWTVMLLLMVISRSHYIWPFCYLILFGCFYMTPFTAEEQEDLFHGALDGILLSFFLFQGFCFLFRPYDLSRYTGIYNNPNLNALFYLEVLAVVFIKILYVTKQSDSSFLKVCYWLGAGVLFSFIFMTIGRTAWITAFILGAVFLVLWNKIREKKHFFRNGIILVLCMCLTFPMCFAAVRYLPPIFHHPVWFWGEWSDERVHSWDAWNSEKYVELEEFMPEALGRVTILLKSALDHSPFALKADAAEAVVEEDPRIDAALLEVEQREKDPLLVRSTIYGYYFSHLNLFGHPYEEQGFQLTRYQWVGHAHNIYLQYGTDFGIPVMILFAVLVVWSCVACWKQGVKKKSITDMAALLFILVPALFGMLECAWGVGSLSIIMLFAAWRRVAV